MATRKEREREIETEEKKWLLKHCRCNLIITSVLNHFYSDILSMKRQTSIAHRQSECDSIKRSEADAKHIDCKWSRRQCVVVQHSMFVEQFRRNECCCARDKESWTSKWNCRCNGGKNGRWTKSCRLVWTTKSILCDGLSRFFDGVEQPVSMVFNNGFQPNGIDRMRLSGAFDWVKRTNKTSKEFQCENFIENTEPIKVKFLV